MRIAALWTTAIVLAIGTMAIPVAVADHGPFCDTTGCCGDYETGVPYSNCTSCVSSGPNSWDTHDDVCYFGFFELQAPPSASPGQGNGSVFEGFLQLVLASLSTLFA